MENPRNLPKTYQEKYSCIYDKLYNLKKIEWSAIWSKYYVAAWFKNWTSTQRKVDYKQVWLQTETWGVTKLNYHFMTAILES